MPSAEIMPGSTAPDADGEIIPIKPQTIPRPYSEWIIYFQLEKNYIYQKVHKLHPGHKRGLFSPEDKDYPGPPLPKRYSDVILPDLFYTVYKGEGRGEVRDYKMKKRADALNISLRDLTAMVRKNWEDADDETKEYVRVMHRIEVQKYEHLQREARGYYTQESDEVTHDQSHSVHNNQEAQGQDKEYTAQENTEEPDGRDKKLVSSGNNDEATAATLDTERNTTMSAKKEFNGSMNAGYNSFASMSLENPAAIMQQFSSMDGFNKRTQAGLGFYGNGASLMNKKQRLSACEQGSHVYNMGEETAEGTDHARVTAGSPTIENKVGGAPDRSKQQSLKLDHLAYAAMMVNGQHAPSLRNTNVDSSSTNPSHVINNSNGTGILPSASLMQNGNLSAFQQQQRSQLFSDPMTAMPNAFNMWQTKILPFMGAGGRHQLPLLQQAMMMNFGRSHSNGNSGAAPFPDSDLRQGSGGMNETNEENCNTKSLRQQQQQQQQHQFSESASNHRARDHSVIRGSSSQFSLCSDVSNEHGRNQSQSTKKDESMDQTIQDDINTTFSLTDEEIWLLIRRGAKVIAEDAVLSDMGDVARPPPAEVAAAIRYFNGPGPKNTGPNVNKSGASETMGNGNSFDKDQENLSLNMDRSSLINGKSNGSSSDNNSSLPQLDNLSKDANTNIAAIAAAATAAGVRLLPPTPKKNEPVDAPEGGVMMANQNDKNGCRSSVALRPDIHRVLLPPQPEKHTINSSFLQVESFREEKGAIEVLLRDNKRLRKENRQIQRIMETMAKATKESKVNKGEKGTGGDFAEEAAASSGKGPPRLATDSMSSHNNENPRSGEDIAENSTADKKSGSDATNGFVSRPKGSADSSLVAGDARSASKSELQEFIQLLTRVDVNKLRAIRTLLEDK